MTIEELEQVIRKYILDIYDKEYIGKIYIEKLDPIGYSVKLGMNVPNKPVTIYAELEDQKFLKFLREELKSRYFNLVHYGQIQLNDAPINTLCNDKR